MTSRRFDSTSFCLASKSPRQIRLASSTSSWALNSRTLPTSLRNSASVSLAPLGLQGSLATSMFARDTLAVQARRRCWVDLLEQLDPKPLEVAVQLFDVAVVEVELVGSGRDLSTGENTDALSTSDQCLDLFKLPKLRYGHQFPPGRCADRVLSITRARALCGSTPTTPERRQPEFCQQHPARAAFVPANERAS